MIDLEQLLEKDRKQRLGQKKDVEEVIGHPFFKDLDIEKLLKKELVPPYIPKVEDLDEIKVALKVQVEESVVTEEAMKKIQDKKDAFEKFGLTSTDDPKKKI